MKRWVPPTARKARTGELTPPGITRWARSNKAWLVVMGRASVHATRRGLGLGFGDFGFGRRRAVGQGFVAILGRRAGPEETVGHHAAHAGAKARNKRLVHEGQRLAHGGLQ